MYKNQFKYQDIAFLLVDIIIRIDFHALGKTND